MFPSHDRKGCHVAGHRGANERFGFYGEGAPATVGGHSKWLVVNAAEKYINMMKNPQVVSIRHNFPLIRERVLQLMGRLEENETPDRMKKLRDTWEQLKKAMPKHMVIGIPGQKAWQELDDEMERVYHDYESWSQILDLMNTESKLVDTELKVVKAIGSMITAEQVIEMQAKQLAAIMECIDDPRILRKIQYRYAQISGSDLLYEAGRSDNPEGDGSRHSNVVDGALLDS
jgi:hypothetical protein